MDADDIALTGQELDAMPEEELDKKLEHIAVYRPSFTRKQNPYRQSLAERQNHRNDW
ncbi:hypothetical protein GCM10027614_84960 [Micromonospora vulcania]